jgi:hypothetical protein
MAALAAYQAPSLMLVKVLSHNNKQTIKFLVFCCVSALAIAGKLDQIDADLLGWWLAERQLPGGGLNGRPEKLPDVRLLENMNISKRCVILGGCCRVWLRWIVYIG